MKKFARIICLSDLHFPYCHKDVFRFLKALKDKYDPDKWVLLGDELDYHALSFHPSDPDLDSAGVEFAKALGYMDTLYEIVGPEADICESNHGSMAYRKGKVNGIPRKLLREYNEVLTAPKGWKWQHEIYVKSTNGYMNKFVHGYKKNVMSESMTAGCNFIQGHHHSQADIRYWSGEYGRYHFGMTVGCMIDQKSLAYAYNKVFSAQPIISHGIIENGVPKLLPMFLKKNGRWNGQVP
jgi:hypothetical protein